MQNILNITNGDCAVGVMHEAGLTGDFLPWRDVLHEGPVPAGLPLQDLSRVRAQFIIERGWAPPDQIIASFGQRDDQLRCFAEYDKVILWFEHDLYDQLQLIQVLDWFNHQPPHGTGLSMICTECYLGPLSPEEMRALVVHEQPVTETQLDLASRAWNAFRLDTPEHWQELLQNDTRALPFLESAVLRMLQEYPGCTNGLSRTAEQALRVLAEGATLPWELFSSNQEQEERVFLGDSAFWDILRGMLASDPPLISLAMGGEFVMPECKNQELRITATGREVLAGERNWLEIADIDRWIGGVHLKSPLAWCWDAESGSIAKAGRVLGTQAYSTGDTSP